MKTIAIDGPAGAGKSTMVVRLSEKYKLRYVDTGALYRCVGLYLKRKGITVADGTDRSGIISELGNMDIRLEFRDGKQFVLLGGEDVTSFLDDSVSKYASVVSAIPEVREMLLPAQRDCAKGEGAGLIMDGRDIGTVVLPDADVKIYLTATAEARAQRRWLELVEKKKEEAPSYNQVLKSVIERDRRDMTRAVAPLKAADDAIIVDTTEKSLDESFEIIDAVVSAKFGVITE